MHYIRDAVFQTSVSIWNITAYHLADIRTNKPPSKLVYICGQRWKYCNSHVVYFHSSVYCLNTSQELKEEEQVVWLLMTVGQSVFWHTFKLNPAVAHTDLSNTLEEKHSFWACRVTSEIKDGMEKSHPRCLHLHAKLVVKLVYTACWVLLVQKRGFWKQPLSFNGVKGFG